MLEDVQEEVQREQEVHEVEKMHEEEQQEQQEEVPQEEEERPLWVQDQLQGVQSGLRELEALRRRQEELVRTALELLEEQQQEVLLPQEMLVLRTQLDSLRGNDAVLLSQLQHLDHQIDELRLDDDKSEDVQQTDSRPSSGFFDASDAPSVSLSNSSHSVFSESFGSSLDPDGRSVPFSSPSARFDPSLVSSSVPADHLPDGRLAGSWDLWSSSSTTVQYSVSALIRPAVGLSSLSLCCPLLSWSRHASLRLLDSGSAHSPAVQSVHRCDQAADAPQSPTPSHANSHATPCQLQSQKRLQSFIFNLLQRHLQAPQTLQPCITVSADCTSKRHRCSPTLGTSWATRTPLPVGSDEQETRGVMNSGSQTGSKFSQPNSQSASCGQNKNSSLDADRKQRRTPTNHRRLSERCPPPSAALPRSHALLAPPVTVTPILPTHTSAGRHQTAKNVQNSDASTARRSEAPIRTSGSVTERNGVKSRRRFTVTHPLEERGSAHSVTVRRGSAHSTPLVVSGETTALSSSKHRHHRNHHCHHRNHLHRHHSNQPQRHHGNQPHRHHVYQPQHYRHHGNRPHHHRHHGTQPKGHEPVQLVTKLRSKRKERTKCHGSHPTADVLRDEALKGSRRHHALSVTPALREPISSRSCRATGSQSEYSAECASLFCSTVGDSGEDGVSSGTTNCFGDGESAQDDNSSDSGERDAGGWGRAQGAVLSVSPTRAEPSVKIRASRNLKKKILQSRNGSLRLMTTI